MIDLTNKKTASTILAATLASGLAAGRLSAPVIDTSAKPVALRWIDDGAGKPSRYAITINVRVGKGSVAREIVCSSDGIPRLDGMSERSIFDDSDARAICDDAVKFGAAASKHVGAIVAKLVR